MYTLSVRVRVSVCVCLSTQSPLDYLHGTPHGSRKNLTVPSQSPLDYTVLLMVLVFFFFQIRKIAPTGQ